MKYDVRADVRMTMDFEIEAEDEVDAKIRVKDYLKYVEGGALQKQKIRIQTKPKDRFTNCFVMDLEIDDVNESD